MGIKEENRKLFGKLGSSTKRHKLPMDGTILRDFWEPTKETKIMFSSSEFLDYCGMIGEPQEFIGVLIKPDGISGHFYPPRLLEMMEFCEWFPEYSIISHLKCNVLINRPMLGARCYYLANRNRNSERILCHSVYNKAYKYCVAGYNISKKRPEITLQQFLRDIGMAAEEDSDPEEK